MSNKTAAIREWALCTGADFQQMDRENTIVLVSCSPLEVHGPHLPVVTDSHESEQLFGLAAEKLVERHPEMRFIKLPPLYTATDVVPQPGSVAFRIQTIIDVLVDLGHSLCCQGFRHIWVSNFHGGPRHFVAIEQAAHIVNQRHDAKMLSAYSMLARRFTNGTSDVSELLSGINGLSKTLLEGDNHAGIIETSLMLHLMGEEHLDPQWRSLSRRTVDMYRKERGEEVPTKPIKERGMLGILRSFIASMKYYESESYAGTPSMATPAIGEELLDFFASKSADILSDYWQGRIPEKETHSPFWPLRHLLLHPATGRLLNWVTSHKSQVI